VNFAHISHKHKYFDHVRMTIVVKKDRILLVDDDYDLCVVLKKGLEKRGFKVDMFNDPLEALSHFKAGNYDLLLLDIKKHLDKKVEICFLTGFDIYQKEFSKVFPSLDLGCCVKKPVSTDELSGTIRKILECV
jgi:DNA-binding response OmpR family regulator